ncbi:glycoside hydrolase family 25 protein [Bacillus anthracis]|uniref:glycoside hydrolase family 25 protein n=1 Tax=Bacillus anthracis TaxID=1392 RepID=UPI002DB6A695|nr:glycoside hydrolase family 25 protein [Bacillus anthracis]MEC0097613.1 glycoside hydrolase family 25 protein [Bacillus anthracis]
MKKIADISYHNGNINWAEASNDLELAIIRVQYGSNKVDSKYKEYVQGCKAYGVPFGHYAYGCYISVQDAIVEARDFMNRADKDAKFLVLDVEDDTLASCGPTNLAKASQAFIDTCRAAGWKVGLYVSHHMYTSYGLNSVSADFLWIPRYGGSKPAYSCDLWQYTETGSVAGITGNVDLNYLVGNKTIEWFIGKGSNSNNPDPTDVDTRKNVSLPPDWLTNNLGWLQCVERQSWVYKEPNELAEVVGKIPLGSGHVYLETAWDGKRFWFKIANDNWVPETVMRIEKDGRSKGVIWNEWEGLECYHHANYNSGIRDRVSVGQWVIEFRDNNWIYIKDKGWVEFDEKIIRWIR